MPRRGKLPEPEGLRLIKEKLELAKRQKLTDEDGLEVDEVLARCHDAHPRGCGYWQECRELDNKLSDFLPTGYRAKLARPYRRGKTDPAECMQATVHGIVIRERVHPII